MNPVTGAMDKLGTRNRNWNSELVGADAARYGARCVTSGLLLSLIAIIWMIVYAGAIATKTTWLADSSTALLLLIGLPLLWLTFRNSAIAARLAADHAEEQLGFRPRWWWSYGSPRGWTNAIDRQKRWHAKGRWPLIPW